MTMNLTNPDKSAADLFAAARRVSRSEADHALVDAAMVAWAGRLAPYADQAVALAALESLAPLVAIAATQPRLVRVPSSDGKHQYALRFEAGSWVCTCTGYAHRGRCRHQGEAAAKVAAEKGSV